MRGIPFITMHLFKSSAVNKPRLFL